MNFTDSLEVFKRKNKCISSKELKTLLLEAHKSEYREIDYFPISNRIEIYDKDSNEYIQEIVRKTLTSLQKTLKELENDNIIFKLNIYSKESDREDLKECVFVHL